MRVKELEQEVEANRVRINTLEDGLAVAKSAVRIPRLVAVVVVV